MHSSPHPSRRTVLGAAAAASTALALGVPGTANAAATDRRRVRALIDRMSIEEKIGQLFVMRVYGHSATAPIRPTSPRTRPRSGSPTRPS